MLALQQFLRRAGSQAPQSEDLAAQQLARTDLEALAAELKDVTTELQDSTDAARARRATPARPGRQRPLAERQQVEQRHHRAGLPPGRVGDLDGSYR